MTEAEAFKLRCCGGNDCGHRIDKWDDGFMPQRYCIGSGCMAWRGLTRVELKVQDDPPDGEGWKGFSVLHGPPQWEREVPNGGYCGLAGKP